MSLRQFLFLCVFSLTLSDSPTYSYFYSGLDWSGQCISSQSQSPLILSNPEYRDQGNSGYTSLHISYTKAQIHTVVHDGPRYQLLGDFGTLAASNGNGTSFLGRAKEVHFHAPSEHLINGAHFDLEVQIVHSVSGTSSSLLPYAILSILFNLGDYNAALSTLENSPTEVDLSLVFNGTKTVSAYYTYSGSFTTPSCSPSVTWFIDSNVLTASSAQLDFFRNLWENNLNFAGGNGNNRLPQEVYNREIVYFQSNFQVQVLLSALVVLILG